MTGVPSASPASAPRGGHPKQNVAGDAQQAAPTSQSRGGRPKQNTAADAHEAANARSENRVSQSDGEETRRYVGDRSLQQIRTQIRKAQECQDLEEARAQHEACLPMLDEAIAARVRPLQAFQLRGKCYLAMQQYQRALSDFTQCMELEPQNSRHQCQRGQCFRHLHRTEDALRAFDQAIRLEKLQGGQDLASSQALAAEYHFERALVFVDLAEESIADVGSEEADEERQLRERVVRENWLVAIKGFEEAKDRLARPLKVHLQLGVCYRNVGNLKASIESFKQAVICDDKKADSHNHLGRSYVDNGNLEAALGAFHRAVQLNPSVQHLNNRGLVHYHLGQCEEAISDFAAALEAEPTNAEIRCNRGNAALKLGWYLEALQNYSEAIELDPKSHVYIYHKGLAYEAQGSGREAIEAYEKALQQQPDHQPSRFHLGLACHLDGQFERALEAFNLCQPMDEALYTARSLVYRDIGWFDLAIADFDRVVESDPANGQHYFNRGVVRHRMGQTEAAIEDLDQAIERGYHEANVYSERGMAWRALGNLAKATQDLGSAIEADGSRNPAFFSSHAQCLFEQGLLSLAEVDLDKALERNSTDPALLYQRGLTRYAQQLYVNAVADLKAALQFEPQEECLADLYYHLGVSYANLGKYPLAAPALDQAVARAPRQPHYLHERAKSLQALHRHEEALRDLNDVIGMQPTNAYALFRRAFSFKAQGLYNEAAEDFEAAKDFAPEDPRLVINYRTVSSIVSISLGPCGHEDQSSSFEPA